MDRYAPLRAPGGVRWKDCDLLLASLRVVQALHRLSDGRLVFTEPKSARSRRSIALSPESCMVLRKHREEAEANAAKLGIPFREEWCIFPHLDGTPRDPGTLTHAFTKIAKRAGFDGLRLHDCRHSHVSLLIKAEVNIRVISQRLGHSNTQLTWDTYGHLYPAQEREAALKFDDLVVEKEPALAD